MASNEAAADALAGASIAANEKDAEHAAAAAAADPDNLKDSPQSDQHNPSAAAPLHGFRLAAVVLGVCLGSLMMSLDISIIATVRPCLSVWLSFPFLRPAAKQLETGRSTTHDRLWRHVSDRLVPRRLHAGNMLYHAPCRQDGLRVPPQHRLPLVHGRLLGRQHPVRLGAL